MDIIVSFAVLKEIETSAMLRQFFQKRMIRQAPGFFCPWQKPRLLLVLFLFWLPALAGEGRPVAAGKKPPVAEAGRPLIQSFSAKQYQSGEQNWDIVQDRRGVMYIANTGGLMEYDGTTWRHFPSEIGSYHQTVRIDSANTVWVGGMRDFGYLAPGPAGQLKFVSLKHKIPAEDRNVEVNWHVELTSRAVYFFNQKVFFRLSGADTTLHAWRPETQILNVFVYRDTLYLSQAERGLMRLANDSLNFVSYGKRFRNLSVKTILPFGPSGNEMVLNSGEQSQFNHPWSGDSRQGEALVITDRNKLFVDSNGLLKPFRTEADRYLQKNIIRCAVVLPGGHYAFGTELGGLVAIDRAGRLQWILTKKNGLPDNNIYAVYLDSRNGLWLGCDMGLARINLAVPITRFREAQGLKRGILDIQRYNDRVFATNAAGLYVLKTSGNPGALPGFEMVQGIRAQCRQLMVAGKQLLVTSNKGLYLLKQNRISLIPMAEKGMPTWLLQSRYDTNLVYVGYNRGLGFLWLEAGNWKPAGFVPGVYDLVEGIVEEAPGILWISTRYGTITKVRFPFGAAGGPLDSSKVVVQQFDKSRGLSPGWNRANYLNGKLLFTTEEGLKHFDPVNQLFVPDSSFGGLFADKTWRFGSIGLVADERGRILAERDGLVGMAVPQADGKYRWETYPFAIFADSNNIWSIYIDKKYPGIYWLGGNYGLYRFDSTLPARNVSPYPTLIRRVIVNGDSIIFDGSTLPQASKQLAYRENTLHFEFSTPFYDRKSAVRYQYMLEGFDNNWSAWVPQSFVDYHNLPEGDYRFRVHARDMYQQTGKEAVYAVIIRPPWYRTWWAYLIYGILIIGLLNGLRRYELNRQRLRNRAELERVQIEKLQELDRLKSDFFANISHEFRTPLTLILGPVEQMIKKTDAGDTRSLSLMRRNARRLLQLVDQLLDLSKLERGKMKLQVSTGDFTAFLKGLVMSFESLAARKSIHLQFVVDDVSGLAESWFDRDKIEKIFTNLLSNAFKFTPAGGTVRVSVNRMMDCPLTESVFGQGQPYEIAHPRCQLCREDSAYQDEKGITHSLNCVRVAVADTGEGIPAEQLPHIFDRFYQAANSSRRDHGGSGIGLTMVKELVNLHYGSIVVISEEGKGTTFKICLPLGMNHLKPEQIVKTVLGDQAGGRNTMNISDEPVMSAPDMESELPAQPGMAGDQHQPDPRPILLIIEDNADVRAYIREQLQTEYRILEAADGEAGIAQATQSIPDLVISDVMMPKRDGYQVCRTLKSDPRTSHIPIILLTAKARADEKLAGLETGADAYVLKPFRQQEIAVRVRGLIELRRKLRRRYSTATTIKPSEVAANSMDRDFLERVVGAIESNMVEEGFGAEMLAGEVAMSVSQLNRKLNALIGQSSGKLIRSMRLQRAADLLTGKAGNVTEIAYMVGFGEQSNFTRAFKKQFNCTPTEYQKAH